MRSAQQVEGREASAAEPQGKDQRRWVWHATEASAEAGTTSVLAIVETMAATAAYACIALRFGTLHLTIAALVVPLLLLRTDYSTRLALRWYRDSLGRAWHVWGTIAISVLLVAALVLAGVCRGLVSKSNAEDAAIPAAVFLSFSVGLVWGGWACVCRAAATLRALALRPRQSVEAIPQNWWRVIGCTDLLVAPLLLPGVIPANVDERLKRFVRPLALVRGLQADLNAAFEAKRSLRWFYSMVKASVLFTSSLVAGALALPAWLYRWSIKGTSLLWGPLVLLVWEAPGTKPEHISESKVALGASIGAGAVVATALGAALKPLLGTDFGLLKGYESLAAAAAKHRAAAAFFPIRGVPIWQWVALAGAIVVLAGYLYARRLKDRGWSDKQKRRVDAAYHALGFISVALIFALIYTAASVADWPPIFGG